MMTVAPPPADTASGDSEVTSGAPGVDPGPVGTKETPGAGAGAAAVPLGTTCRNCPRGARRDATAARSRLASPATFEGLLEEATADLDESRVTMTVRRQSAATRRLCRLCRHRFHLVNMAYPSQFPPRRRAGKDGNGERSPPISATRLTQRVPWLCVPPLRKICFCRLLSLLNMDVFPGHVNQQQAVEGSLTSMVRMATYVEQLTPTLDGTILLNGSIQQGDQLTENFVTQPSEFNLSAPQADGSTITTVNGGAATVTLSIPMVHPQRSPFRLSCC